MTSLNRLALDSNPELCGFLPSEWTADPPAVQLILTFDTRLGLTCLPRSNSTSGLVPTGEQMPELYALKLLQCIQKYKLQCNCMLVTQYVHECALKILTGASLIAALPLTCHRVLLRCCLFAVWCSLLRL